ncbi:SDR family oxidoreductase [Nocardiopsis sp. CA-288880]|uniref:SDR family oxidoreductase n=1 Tax=Nocardiopsis sp. CA-288880 TaxID=3239995 RepID=UPI003D988E88
MADDVTVVIGAGGMGEAIAARIGAGTRLLLADRDEELLSAVAERLAGQGYDVAGRTVDVADRGSVAGLARAAAGSGAVRKVVHTAGVSPVQAPVPAILAVDLLGVALVLEEFAEAVAPGGAGLVISSMASYGPVELSPQEAVQLASAPADRLLSLPVAARDRFPDSGRAYAFAKRANRLRVQGASVVWGAKGARVNSISPGVVSTPMGRGELNGEHGRSMRAMVEASNARRVGTPADIAAAAEFLLGPSAGFVSGADLLVDGGVIASSVSGALG